MGKLQLDIATPEKLVFSGEVDYVSAPGGLGEFTVLPNHTPLLTTISPGIVRFRSGSEERVYAVGWGYAEVRPYKVVLLVEFANTREEIDPKELQEQMEQLQKRLASASTEEERESLRKQLERLRARKRLVA